MDQGAHPRNSACLDATIVGVPSTTCAAMRVVPGWCSRLPFGDACNHGLRATAATEAAHQAVKHPDATPNLATRSRTRRPAGASRPSIVRLQFRFDLAGLLTAATALPEQVQPCAHTPADNNSTRFPSPQIPRAPGAGCLLVCTGCTSGLPWGNSGLRFLNLGWARGHEATAEKSIFFHVAFPLQSGPTDARAVSSSLSVHIPYRQPVLLTVVCVSHWAPPGVSAASHSLCTDTQFLGGDPFQRLAARVGFAGSKDSQTRGRCDVHCLQHAVLQQRPCQC
jgi:hypothetical protein